MGIRILEVISEKTLTMAEILKGLGYKSRNRKVKTALSKLIANQLVAMTTPNSPINSRQKYQITDLGKQILDEQ